MEVLEWPPEQQVSFGVWLSFSATWVMQAISFVWSQETSNAQSMCWVLFCSVLFSYNTALGVSRHSPSLLPGRAGLWASLPFPRLLCAPNRVHACVHAYSHCPFPPGHLFLLLLPAFAFRFWDRAYLIPSLLPWHSPLTQKVSDSMSIELDRSELCWLDWAHLCVLTAESGGSLESLMQPWIPPQLPHSCGHHSSAHWSMGRPYNRNSISLRVQNPPSVNCLVPLQFEGTVLALS